MSETMAELSLTLSERYREHESIDNFNRFRWGPA